MEIAFIIFFFMYIGEVSGSIKGWGKEIEGRFKMKNEN